MGCSAGHTLRLRALTGRFLPSNAARQNWLGNVPFGLRDEVSKGEWCGVISNPVPTMKTRLSFFFVAVLAAFTSIAPSRADFVRGDFTFDTFETFIDPVTGATVPTYCTAPDWFRG